MMQFEKLRRYMEEELVGAKGVPGCDILVMRGHEPVFRHFAGMANREENRAMQGDELYYMYSCTKPVTVTAGMRLVEEGRLLLDAPVSAYLPEYAHLTVRDGDGVRPAERIMTVRHLFTMTAGLNYNTASAPIRQLLAERGENASTREVVAAIAQEPLDFEPGERFQYSLCHDVLGAVIEEVAGERYADYLRKTIFEPLGMTRTGMHPNAQLRRKMAAQYSYSVGEGIRPAGGGNGFVLSPAYDCGGAGIVSCVEDYARFADTLACGGTSVDGYRLLRPETIAQMRTEQLGSVARNAAFSCAAGPGYGYALGVRTSLTRCEFGWDGAAGADLMMDTQNQLSFFFAMHVLGWPTLVGCVHAALRDLVYEAMRV